MHLFINSAAASAGGGLTYIRNVLPTLAGAPGLNVTVTLSPGLRQELGNLTGIQFIEVDSTGLRRFWYEQSTLAAAIRNSGAEVLLSAGNVALRRSPVPQILLSRNSLYTSADFYRDLVSRHAYRSWFDARLRGVIARRSIAWADATVAPSKAFAAELRDWTGNPHIVAIHHGFDQKRFASDANPLANAVAEKLKSAEAALKLLFVSHYNYYRNFETLIRSLPLLRKLLPHRSVNLLLTCRLSPGQNPGAYKTESAARLVTQLGVSDMVLELGAIPYGQLHQLYRQADIYVTPAYAETFAHPLVEAMASGLPIVASDLPVHREICESAAIYFPRFSPQDLAHRIAELATSSDLATQTSLEGLARSQAFSWKKHVDELLALAHSLVVGVTEGASVRMPAE